ncbi:putative acetyltransferase [Vigna angularis]|uniref:Putative acetyltransferase n=1 Tax=Phaseolus angularis TaxID=3914 RepID=A0A8T0L9I4_PHAAN|nr:putative acetyltransferase [Vigna angularis]
MAVISKCTVVPHQNSTLGDLKLSISDLNMFLAHYIQKGCLFTTPSHPSHTLIPHLTNALSRTLSIFPPLAGRFKTNAHGHVYIACNDAGVDFIHATATNLSVTDLLSPSDVHSAFKKFFPFHHKLSYTAHSSPIMAIQVTELADGIFIGCAVCHAVTDGSSFWNFFNTFSAVSRGLICPSRLPDFHRESILMSKVVLRLPQARVNRESIQKLKGSVNNSRKIFGAEKEEVDVELMAKLSNDTALKKVAVGETTEISSFQALCALMWRCVTRARNLEKGKTTTLRMAVNVRQRSEPKLGDCYFGNAIQSIVTHAVVGDVVSMDLGWCAEQVHKSVTAFSSDTVRRNVENWEREPKCFELGNHDGPHV